MENNIYLTWLEGGKLPFLMWIYQSASSTRLKHADLLVGPASMKLLPTFSLHQPHISNYVKNVSNYLHLFYSFTQVSVSKPLWASAVIHESLFWFLLSWNRSPSAMRYVFSQICPVSGVVLGLWVTIICAFKFPVYFRHTLSTLQVRNGALWRTNTQVQQSQKVSMKNTTFVKIFIIFSE